MKVSIIEFLDLIGIPFKHKGRSLEAFDCWGLVLELYKRVGIKLIDPVPDYNKDWKHNKSYNLFLENYHRQWKKLGKNEIPGLLDVVLFGTEPEFPTHAGVIVVKRRVLHCNENQGVILTPLSNLEKFINGYYRLKDDYSSDN